jgi:hypothetical protein
MLLLLKNHKFDLKGKIKNYKKFGKKKSLGKRKRNQK